MATESTSATSGGAGWRTFNTTIIIFISLLVFLRFILPFILYLFNTSIQVRSVSPLSIRGLRVRKAGMTLTAERIALTWGRQVVEGARRFHFKFEDVRFSLDTSQSTKRSPKLLNLKNQRRNRRFSIYTLTGDNLAPPLAIFASILPVSLLRRLDRTLRPFFRVLFVSSFRLAISGLPLLAQAFDFEFDTVMFSSPNVKDACVVIEGITFATTVNFTQFKVLSDGMRSDVENERLRNKRVGRVASWKVRFHSGVGRIWDRAWGKTTGSFSVTLKFDRAGLYPRLPSIYPIKHASSGFLRSRAPSYSASSPPPANASETPDADPTKESVFIIPLPTRLHASVQFTPKVMALSSHTLDINASVPAVEVALNALQELLEAQPKPQHRKPSEPSLSFKMPSVSPSSPTGPNLPVRNFMVFLTNETLTEFLPLAASGASSKT